MDRKIITAVPVGARGKDTFSRIFPLLTGTCTVNGRSDGAATSEVEQAPDSLPHHRGNDLSERLAAASAGIKAVCWRLDTDGTF